MAFVTDTWGGGAFSVRTQPGKRAKTAGIGFPTGVIIAGGSVATVFCLAAAFAALHGSPFPSGAKFDSVALVSPQDRMRFEKFEQERNIRPEKTARLYPLMANDVVVHAAKAYEVPPRQAVASVNVPVLALKNEAIAQAVPVPTAPPPVVATTITQADPKPVEVANVDTADMRFGLVMPQPAFEAPLPMARPEGWPKAPAPVVEQKAKAEPPKQVLAYANPNVDDGSDGLPPKAVAPKMQAGVAIYDISAQMVYLPDGTRMEAHSGLGEFRDNPRYVAVKGKGPTPPNTYKLSMRESLFHGVPALRLTPSDGQLKYGRNGLLAHTYLRRRPGDSAGCIAFKDYYKFLKYYKRGEISQIVVVAKLSDAPPAKRSTLASLFGG
jgi:hypothetical protein